MNNSRLYSYNTLGLECRLCRRGWREGEILTHGFFDSLAIPANHSTFATINVLFLSLLRSSRGWGIVNITLTPALYTYHFRGFLLNGTGLITETVRSESGGSPWYCLSAERPDYRISPLLVIVKDDGGERGFLSVHCTCPGTFSSLSGLSRDRI